MDVVVVLILANKVLVQVENLYVQVTQEVIDVHDHYPYDIVIVIMIVSILDVILHDVNLQIDFVLNYKSGVIVVDHYLDN